MSDVPAWMVMDSSFVLLTFPSPVAPSMVAWTVNLCSVTACVGIPGNGAVAIQGQSIGQRRAFCKRPCHRLAGGRTGYQLSVICYAHIAACQALRCDGGQGGGSGAVCKADERFGIGRSDCLPGFINYDYKKISGLSSRIFLAISAARLPLAPSSDWIFTAK